jgi:hypothetical protein
VLTKKPELKLFWLTKKPEKKPEKKLFWLTKKPEKKPQKKLFVKKNFSDWLKKPSQYVSAPNYSI